MKRTFLFVLTLFSIQSFAQEVASADDVLTTKVIGAWEHISSNYPSGNVSRYRKEFEFYIGGQGICTEFYDNDTVYANFNWEVIDSTIHVFVADDRGNKVNTDSQFIASLDELNLFLPNIWTCRAQKKDTLP